MLVTFKKSDIDRAGGPNAPFFHNRRRDYIALLKQIKYIKMASSAPPMLWNLPLPQQQQQHQYQQQQYPSVSAEPTFDLDALYASDARRREESERMYELVLRKVYALVRRVNCLNRRLTAAEYTVPRVHPGRAVRYNWSECVAFLVERLTADGFQVNVRRQTLLYLSWGHWIPAAEREAFHRSTGSRINGCGRVIAPAPSLVRQQQKAEPTTEAPPQPPAPTAAERAKVKPASALKFRPTPTAVSAIYSDDVLDSTFS